MGHATLLALDDFFIDEKIPYGVRGLGTFVDPVLYAFHIEHEFTWIFARIVVTKDFGGDRPWVVVLWHYDHAIDRSSLGSHTGESN